MVLESLISPLKAEKRPWELFFLGGLYSSVAVFISLQIFRQLAGLVAVFLTVMASIPLVFAIIKFEEAKDLSNQREPFLVKEHGKARSSFFFLFLGIMVSLSAWYAFLPASTAAESFSVQIDTIKNINAGTTAGAAVQADLFSTIFFNNMKVLMFSVLFAFFYGAGAMFILTWNASVIAVALGTFIRNNMAVYAGHVGMAKLAAYLHTFSLSLARYMIHGTPEILAYFVGGLAGGIISVAIIRHDFFSEKFEKILLDSADLLLISVVLLLIGASFEVFLTPSFFS